MPSKIKGQDESQASCCESHQGNAQTVSAEQGATDHKTSKEGTAKSDKKENPTEPPRSFVGWSLLFDALLVIATSIYVCFAYQQWKTMDNQANIMKGQLVAAQDIISPPLISNRYPICLTADFGTNRDSPGASTMFLGGRRVGSSTSTLYFLGVSPTIRQGNIRRPAYESTTIYACI